jgi:hypothetical protein
MSLYFWKPSSAKKYHVFLTDTGRALCGSYQDFGSIADEGRSIVTGNEKFDPTTDCKKCFERIAKWPDELHNEKTESSK